MKTCLFKLNIILFFAHTQIIDDLYGGFFMSIPDNIRKQFKKLSSLPADIISAINIKLALRSLSCAVIICGLLSMTGFCAACEDIGNRILRFHIIANSDSREDQAIKLRVRDRIIALTDELFAGCSTKEEAINAARSHLSEIREKALETVKTEGKDQDIEVYITKMHFDTRVYRDFTLPAGEYDALRIVIGKGQGHNWWCVLYPAVCVPSAEKNIGSALNKNETDIVTQSDKYIVKFKVLEWLGSIFT